MDGRQTMTFIFISVAVAVDFHGQVTSDALPAFVAAAAPRIVLKQADAMIIAQVWTTI